MIGLLFMGKMPTNKKITFDYRVDSKLTRGNWGKRGDVRRLNAAYKLIVSFGIIRLMALKIEESANLKFTVNCVKNINIEAISNNQLTSIIIPDSVRSLGSNVFRDNQLTSVTIPLIDTAIYYRNESVIKKISDPKVAYLFSDFFEDRDFKCQANQQSAG